MQSLMSCCQDLKWPSYSLVTRLGEDVMINYRACNLSSVFMSMGLKAFPLANNYGA